MFHNLLSHHQHLISMKETAMWDNQWQLLKVIELEKVWKDSSKKSYYTSDSMADIATDHWLERYVSLLKCWIQHWYECVLNTSNMKLGHTKLNVSIAHPKLIHNPTLVWKWPLTIKVLHNWEMCGIVKHLFGKKSRQQVDRPQQEAITHVYV